MTIVEAFCACGGNASGRGGGGGSQNAGISFEILDKCSAKSEFENLSK